MASSEIMLIDDDRIQFVLVRGLLRKLKPDYNIVYYSNPEEGFNDLIHRKPEDLPLFVFLDLNMPEMTGWEFLDKYDSCSNKAKIVLLTSSIDKADEIRANNNRNIMAFRTKPLSEMELNDIIQVCSVIP